MVSYYRYIVMSSQTKTRDAAKDSPRRRLPRDERLRQLLDVSWSLISEEGADALTLGRLADAAGVTKPVVMEVEFNQAGPTRGGYKAGFDGEATIKRSDFGINFGLPALGDEVKLHIEGEFEKAAG